ncbi:MAG: hypothetical protein JNJ46_16670 [Myxococcales bacterium]|nr:hypothetical protein [Myxococcales bacterium]
MPVSDLAAFGLVPHEVHAAEAVLRMGSAQNAEPLLLSPLVVRALRAGLIEEARGHWLVVSGAVTGKSSLASLLLLHAYHRGQRAILVRHGRSFRRQTREALSDVLSPDEAKAGIVSLGQLLRRLNRDRGSLADLDLLLIDDLDRLLHPRHARWLARLLRWLRLHAPSLPVVALCDHGKAQAAIARFAEPLAAQLLLGPEPEPPVVGSLTDGPKAAGFPVQPTTVDRQDLQPVAFAASNGIHRAPRHGAGELADSLLDFVRRREPTLVLVPQRSQMLRLLHRLLDTCERSSPAFESRSQAALAALSLTARGHAQDLLRVALPFGIALEGPELTPKQLRLVREAQARRDVLLTLCHRVPARPWAGTQVQNIVYVPSRSAESSLAPHEVPTHAQHRTDTLPPGLLRRVLAGGRILIADHGSHAVSCGLRDLVADAHPSTRQKKGGSLSGCSELAAFLRFLPPLTATAENQLAALEALTLAALTGPRLPLPLLLTERERCDYAALLRLRVDEKAASDRPLFRWLATQSTRLSHDDLRALKGVLLLDDWLDGAHSVELEDRYHIWAGQLVQCARSMARRLQRLRPRILPGQKRHGRPQPPCALDEVIRRLRHAELDGVAEHRAALSRHVGVLLGAVHALDVQVPNHTARVRR